MIYARLAFSEQHGLFSQAGLLLRDLSVPPAQQLQQQYQAYILDLPIEKPHFYRSRSSLQTILFALFDQVSPFSDVQNISVFKWIASIVSAACLTAFLYWILLVGGWSAAILTALGSLFSPWLTVSGGHLFWFSGVFFLPLVYVAFRLHRSGRTLRYGYFTGAIALTFLLKNLLTGYELITTSLVMCTLPVFFYAFRQKWSLRQWAGRFSAVSAGLLLGLALAVGILLLQTSQLQGPQRTGIANLKERLLLRTIGVSEQQNIPPQIKASREASLRETMQKYWRQPLLTLPHIPRWLPLRRDRRSLQTAHLLLFGIVLAVAGLGFTTLRPLAATTLISYLAPASWFVIFRAHAYLHPFLDPLAWYLPTVLLIYALAGAWLQQGWRILGGYGEKLWLKRNYSGPKQA